jgi:predicted RNA-binding Zn ribbon-like protein
MIDEADRYLWVGNHPGLDLVNTGAADANGDALELVPDWSALVGWARAAGLVDAALADQCLAADSRRARATVAWFHRLRSSLRAVLESGDGGDAAAALDAAVAEVPVRLTFSPAGADLLVDSSRPLDRMRLALATAALDAARLERSRVRRCEGARCVLLYLDTTKNGSRRWCDMASCGNRAKASAHYHRTKRSRLQGSRHSQPG